MSAPAKTVYSILIAICVGHLLNDFIQSSLMASYPLLKDRYALSYGQIGLITLAFQVTSSLLQPFVGAFTDKRPQPYSFVFGMFFLIAGTITLAFANSFSTILMAACAIGIGSSVFHPEASRVSFYASGGRRGLAQSIFQLGGNAGASLGPLLVGLLVLQHGQSTLLYFLIAPIAGILLLSKVGKWYNNYLNENGLRKKVIAVAEHGISTRRVRWSIAILLILIFSKFFYSASISNYYVFYLKEKFHLDTATAQFHLFFYLMAFTFGTLIGGPLGDKYGRQKIIWFSIAGAAPFTLALPYLNLEWTSVFICLAGAILASAFSSILVYAQELLPGKIGMISGLFYGFAFGMGGLGSAVLGALVDTHGIEQVYVWVSFLPLLGLIALLLPKVSK